MQKGRAEYLVSLDLRPEAMGAVIRTARRKGLTVDDLLMLFCEAMTEPCDPEDLPIKEWAENITPVGLCSSFVEWEAHNGSPGEMGTTLRLIREGKLEVDQAFADYFRAEDEARTGGPREAERLQECQRALDDCRARVERLEFLEEQIYERYAEHIGSRYSKEEVWTLDDCLQEVEMYENGLQKLEADGMSAQASRELSRRLHGGGFSPVG